MKRFLLIIMIMFLCILTSCSSGSRNEYAPNADAVPYEEYKTFNVDGKTYRVFLPENVNDSLSFYYYDLELKSDKEEWVVNTLVDLGYKTSNQYNATEELLDKVYEFISVEEYLNGLAFTPVIKKSGEYEIEEIISNNSKENVSCKVFITYINISIRENRSRFYLSIPVYETILKTTETCISDPFTKEDITNESFNRKYR